MKCPFCDDPDTKVIDSRPTEEGKAIRRRRECPACGKRFNPGSLLAETVVLSPEMTTKVLVASPADADTAELPAVPVVDEESEAKRFGDYDI